MTCWIFPPLPDVLTALWNTIYQPLYWKTWERRRRRRILVQREQREQCSPQSPGVDDKYWSQITQSRFSNGKYRKTRKIFLATSQRLNLIWRALCQLLLSLFCSCPKSQTRCTQPPQWVRSNLFCLRCAWNDLGWRSLGKTKPKPSNLSSAEAKLFLILLWKVSP